MEKTVGLGGDVLAGAAPHAEHWKDSQNSRKRCPILQLAGCFTCSDTVVLLPVLGYFNG